MENKIDCKIVRKKVSLPRPSLFVALSPVIRYQPMINTINIPALQAGVDASTNLHATEVLDSESCDDSDHDDTLWDWMTPTMMRLIELAGISCNALTKTNFYH
ncbi:hypothetical protein R6Q59_020065 [Mikania micrantha]